MNLNPTVSPDLLCSELDSPIVAKHQKIIHSTGYYLLILTNLKKMLLNLDHFPKDRVENKKPFETTMYLEDHPSGPKRIITMVIISLLKIGLFFNPSKWPLYGFFFMGVIRSPLTSTDMLILQGSDHLSDLTNPWT